MSQYTQLNTNLVEEFGNLEQVCNQMYSTTHGVTAYIEEMQSCDKRKAMSVVNWDAHLEMLKRVRYKRNRLSHGEESFDAQFATQDDVDYLVLFKNDILRQKDPLSRYSRLASERKTTDSVVSYTKTANSSKNSAKNDENEELKEKMLRSVSYAFGIIFLILIFIYITT